MFLIYIYRLITGYVELVVSGEFCEKILNLLAVNKVTVWDIKRSNKEISLKIYIRDFKKIRKIRGKSKLHIKISNKYGIIFAIKKYFKRIGIPVGILIYFTTLYVLSLFLWNITVTGNKKVSTLAIENYCNQLGVRQGVAISKINSQLLREKLLLLCDGLSWCSFNIEGSKITVNVSEISENINDNLPSNIISDYDCIISDIYVESGVANVKKGDAVTKGQLLVSGVSDIDSVNRFVKSKARISAEIHENVTVSADFSGEKNVFSGEIKEKYALEFFGVKIPLYLGRIDGEYSEELMVKNLYFFGEKIPIRSYKKLFYIQEKQLFSFNREQLLPILTAEIEGKISGITENYEVVSRNVFEKDNTLVVSYEIKYTKKIGLEEKLIFNVSN